MIDSVDSKLFLIKSYIQQVLMMPKGEGIAQKRSLEELIPRLNRGEKFFLEEKFYFFYLNVCLV